MRLDWTIVGLDYVYLASKWVGFRIFFVVGYFLGVSDWFPYFQVVDNFEVDWDQFSDFYDFFEFTFRKFDLLGGACLYERGTDYWRWDRYGWCFSRSFISLVVRFVLFFAVYFNDWV